MEEELGEGVQPVHPRLVDRRGVNDPDSVRCPEADRFTTPARFGLRSGGRAAE
jgi:hypothetical protein